MSGIWGALKNKEIEKVANELLISDFLEKKDTYVDDSISLMQISLKKNDFKMLNKDNVIIFVEGYCYNLDELKEIFSVNINKFSEFLLWAHQNNCLKSFLNKVDGFFNATIYDKIKKKILLITDRLGTRFLYFYHKDDVFAFCAEVKGILALPNIDKEIDKNSLECFTQGGVNFYPLGNNTMFKNIKLLEPSTILEYDIESNNISQEYYWKFSEIKKSNTTYEESIDILHNLVENAVLKRVSNLDLKISELPLSGGLDSRLIFAILDRHNKMPAYIFTNGTKNCTDVAYAKKLCKKFGYKHNINLPMKYSNYVEHGKDYPWKSDGHLIYIEQCSYKHPIDYHYLINGYVGDMVFGSSFKDFKEHFDKRMNPTIAEKFYGKYHKFSDYENDFYDIDKIEAHLFMNRVRRFTAQMLNYGSNQNEYILPFIDNKIIEFIYSIPDEYRAKSDLYSDMLLKYYPEYFNEIPWSKDNLPIKGRIYKNNVGNINSLLEKIQNCKFLSQKFRNSIKKRVNFYNFIYKSTFHIYPIELSKKSNIKLIKEKYINDNSLLKKYINTNAWNNILNSVNKKMAKNIALALSAEFYLRSLNEKGYLTKEWGR